jgi:hypothetical protein
MVVTTILFCSIHDCADQSGFDIRQLPAGGLHFS